MIGALLPLAASALQAATTTAPAVASQASTAAAGSDFGAAMAQGDRWRTALPAGVTLSAVFATPLLARVPGGWRARPETCARDCCPLLD